jgi:threonine aldolase
MNHELKEQFASDNYSGICPQAMEYLVKANNGHDYPYGDDQWTKEACNLFRELFEIDCDVYFALTGTAANSLALASLCESYHSIISHEVGHIETDECGAPEFFSNGAKILLAKGRNGKINCHEIEKILEKRTDIHYPKPKIVSVTQATELGTVYQPAELLEINKISSHYNMKFHMDGARFANALTSLNLSPKELSWQCGVDVLCLGGVKNGISMGDAVIFFNRELSEDFVYRCKQAGQLASKMRFISAQWVGILKNNVWLQNAAHANKCTALLESKLKEIPEIEIMFPREANSVFVKLPESVLQELKNRGWHFYTFIGVGGARFMCTWNTTEKRVLELVKDIKMSFAKKVD